MRKTVKGFAAGFLTCVLLSSTLVWAATGTQNISVTFRNIKVYVDGVLFQLIDANGNAAEPFIYNGTVYMPLRAVANSVGKEVSWDGDTSSVYVGKKGQGAPVTYLDKLQYSDFKAGLSSYKFYLINGKITDLQDNIYTNGFLLEYQSYKIKNDPDEADVIMDYQLNAQYSKLDGKIVLPASIDIAGLNKKSINEYNSPADVLFYGDGRLLYKATNVTPSMPFNFSVNVNGVLNLTIKFVTKGVNSYTALTDLALYE